jgi:hypothetical protein
MAGALHVHLPPTMATRVAGPRSYCYLQPAFAVPCSRLQVVLTSQIWILFEQ